MIFLRVLTTLHGFLGVLAVAGLLHPAILLRRGQALGFRTGLSVALSAGFALAALGSGLLVYGDYRRLVRIRLFQDDPAAGLLFETKEHLAVVACSLALGATFAAFLAPREERGLRRAAAVCFGVAAALTLVTAALGTYVAAVRSFG